MKIEMDYDEILLLELLKDCYIRRYDIQIESKMEEFMRELESIIEDKKELKKEEDNKKYEKRKNELNQMIIKKYIEEDNILSEEEDIMINESLDDLIIERLKLNK